MSETLTWIDADGNSYDLSGQTDREWLLGTQGRFMPPFRFVENEVPLQPGARLRTVKTLPREVDIPLLFKAASETALRTLVRDYLHRFNPGRGDGKLRVTAPGGDQRELNCRYAGGMQLVEAGEKFGFRQRMVLTFRAFDPYWYATSDTTDTYTTGTPATFFPFFPLRLTSSTIFASPTINNTGDVECWPVWTITGPGSSIALRNLTTDKLISLSTTLAAGETITIDTRPGKKTVTKNDGTNLYGDLSSDSELWPLERGNNSVQIEMSSATSASQVVISYRLRYLGA